MNRIRIFGQDERGTTAVIFGLTLLPLMAAAGGAIDYSRTATARGAVQKAVDVTALTLARDAAALTKKQLVARGRQVFAANFQGHVDTIVPPIAIERDGKSIHVTAEGAVKLAFMPVFGKETAAIKAEAVVGWGTRKIELAMVLDNTGSMADPLGSARKIDALKQATHDLLTTAEQAAPEPGAIKVAIVPFATQVKVGTLLSPLGLDFSFGIDEPTWMRLGGGCTKDRSQTGDYDVNDAPASRATNDSLFPAVVCGEPSFPTNTLAKMQPLTTQFSDLHATVDAMNPGGCTNITIGTTWGLKTLSNASPLTDGVDFGTKDVDKIMVVLTDGDNTRNRWVNASPCPGGSGSAAGIDARTRLACNAAKDKGVMLFTVLVGPVKPTSVQLLKDCVGNGGTFQQVNDAAAIGTVFKQILNRILDIRLTQ